MRLRKIVQHQDLMCFRQAELPRNAGMFDARQRRSAGTAAVAGNQNNVRMRFCHAGRDRSDADFRNQLYADARARIGVLEIVNQLRQIFDRINIVMRRR